MALSPELKGLLDEVMAEELCVSKAEALRRLVAHWRRTRGDAIRQNRTQVPQNDLRGSFGTDVQRKYRDVYTTSVMLDHSDLRSAHAYMRKVVLIDRAEIINELY